MVCLRRGIALPHTFAVSGWTDGAHGTSESAFDRTVLIDEVFKLAKVLEYDLGEDSRDAPGRPGSFLACHSEKQLLAFLISQHTTAFLEVYDPDRILSSLRKKTWVGSNTVAQSFDAPTPTRLKADIFVCQPGRNKAWLCDECIQFCWKAAEKLDLHWMSMQLRKQETYSGAN